MHMLKRRGGLHVIRERARLIRVENFHMISKETDCKFLFEHQRAILLALKDSGILSEIQYHLAEDRLKGEFAAFM